MVRIVLSTMKDISRLVRTGLVSRLPELAECPGLADTLMVDPQHPPVLLPAHVRLTRSRSGPGEVLLTHMLHVRSIVEAQVVNNPVPEVGLEAGLHGDDQVEGGEDEAGD